jgi:hypothetical protein
MISAETLALLLGALVLIGVWQGSTGPAITLALLGFIVVGIASGLLPSLGLTTGFNGDETVLTLDPDAEVTHEQEGVAVGNCVWDRERKVAGEPARPAAAFELTNRSDRPKRVRVELIFGNARTPSRDGQPIFTEVHGWTAAPADDAHWLIPPRVPPRLADPNTIPQPVDPVTLTAPDPDLDSAITWCGVRLADVRDA